MIKKKMIKKILFFISIFIHFFYSDQTLVAFRLDDIQDYWISTSQQAVMGLFQQQNLPLTIGIIGNYFGADASMVNFVQ